MNKSKSYLIVLIVILMAIFSFSCNVNQGAEIKFKVYFNSDGGTPVQTQTIKSGEKVIKPSDPVKSGDENFTYEFSGWYIGETAWDFENNVVIKDITLTALYKQIKKSDASAKSFVVTFDSDGGTVISPRTVLKGSTVEEPQIPKKNSTSKYDYEFIGWFLEDKRWNFDNDTVQSDIKLVARYKISESTEQYKPTE